MNFFSQIKQTTHTFESYLNIGNDNQRKGITKLRLSSHRLESGVGRWNEIRRHERICWSCEQGKVENETHFSFECSKYTQERIIHRVFCKNTVYKNTVYKNTVYKNTVYKNTVYKNTVYKNIQAQNS